MKHLLFVLLLQVAALCQAPQVQFYTGQRTYSRQPVYVTPNPEDIGSSLYFGLIVRDSRVVHIYSSTGLVDSMILQFDPEIYAVGKELHISKTIVDADSNWETLAIDLPLHRSISSKFFMIDDYYSEFAFGDSGIASYAFDGKSTYIYSKDCGDQEDRGWLKVWKFREDVNQVQVSQKNKQSVKKIVTSPSPGIFSVSVTLDESGQTVVQTFDAMGRSIFTRKIK